ncbi:MAG: septum site-determining protein MinC [Anaerolineae bacterium]|uniref:septum site-determining protein MinC n=1 Tax=Promineifilum sp. TaxID=2664178 RepID=UPI001D6BEAFC|nr:septum site-determining protein MinC [Anaerolineales bacterium]MCO5178847.1 septum site-determining protein MinC [Promineifilum sp.]MCW5848380.1 septum site-determining protein MinC [Anaerolineae bacterium]
MARQIDIKGIRDGLLIRVNDGPDFAVYERLRRELEQKRDFLQGGRVTVELGRRPLNREQLAGLQELFVAHDLELWAVIADDGDTRATARELGLATRLSGSATDLEGNARVESANGSAAPKTPPAANALLLRETLRSGRSVWHEGHVVVLGDVNPGAEIIATGNVVVWGRLRGLVHAGVGGDAAAVICALDLSPTQLRIADHIAVAPDDARPATIPEQATVRDGQIVAEPWRKIVDSGQ